MLRQNCKEKNCERGTPKPQNAWDKQHSMGYLSADQKEIKKFIQIVKPNNQYHMERYLNGVNSF